jgi:hypothetical protein
LLRFQATTVVAYTTGAYAAGVFRNTKHSPMRVILTAGLALSCLIGLTVTVPNMLASVTSAGGGSVVETYPTPDPHP